MAFAVMHHFPGGTNEQYEASTGTVHPARDVLPLSQILHAAGPTAGGWTIVAVHGSNESRERCRDGVLRPAMGKRTTGSFTSQPHETAFDAHNCSDIPAQNCVGKDGTIIQSMGL